MGLDMFLYRRSWVDNSEWIKPEHRAEIKMTKGCKEVDTSKIRYIVEEVGYWRKANAIHKWFVDNVQGGEDDCGQYRVDREQLKELKELCEKSLKAIESGYVDTVQELLPTQQGFFFGSKDYDGYYTQDLRDTVKIIDSALSEPYGEITYSSSW